MDYDFILNCFTDNYIGLRGGCNAAISPLSGYWVNEISGVNINTLSDLASKKDDIKAEEYLLYKQQAAIKLVCEDVLAQVNKLNLFNPQAALKSETLGSFTANYHIPNFNNAKFGVQIIASCDNLGCLYIPSIEVLLQNSGVITGEIIEGSFVTPFSFNSIANQITYIQLNYKAKYECSKGCKSVPIQILIQDNNFLSPNKSDIKYSSCKGCGLSRNGIQIQGYNGGTLSNTTTYGIKVPLVIGCCFEQIFCNFKKQMGLPVLWKLASLIYEDMLLNTRLNQATLAKKDEKEYFAGVCEEKYKAALDSLCFQLQTTLRNYKSTCIPCTGAKIGIVRS